MEVLRIVSMCFVMLAHCLDGSLGIPAREDFLAAPADAGIRLFLSCSCAICVNVFVLISGWFGIHTSAKGLFKLVFQCVFMAIAVYAGLLLAGNRYSIKESISIIANPNNWWFVYAYILLYTMSPILNAFVESTGKRQYQILLVSFFVFQTLYGFWNSLPYFKGGYSPLSFMGLYLLARYVRKYSPRWSTWSAKKDLGAYLCLSVILTILVAALSCSGRGLLVWFGYSLRSAYSSPFIIASSLFVVLAFSKMRFYNKYVNAIAASAFAVYLIHNHLAVHHGYFKIAVKAIYDDSSLLTFYPKLMAFLVCVFFACVAVDRIRLFLQSIILRHIKL